MTLDMKKLEPLLGTLVNELGAAANAALVFTGDRLGLYRAMTDGHPVTPDQLAARTGTTQPGGKASADADDESDRKWGEPTVMRAPPWSQRDRRIFVSAVLGAVGVGAFIVFA